MMKRGLRLITALSIMVCLSGVAVADVKLPAIFSDHMVLLKADKVPVWGKADPGEKVSVLLNGQTLETTAGKDGKWRVSLNLAESPEGPFEMVVKGKNTIKIADVVVGEVWLGSGQSNMEQAMMSQVPSKEETATAVNPMLRQFIVTKIAAFEHQEEVDGFWLSVKPGSTETMSAVGYFFSKEIHREIKRPVGFIKASWGGKAIDMFISSSAYDSDPGLKTSRTELWGEVKKGAADFEAWLKTTQRMDRADSDVKAFLEMEATPENGWVKVKDSGLLEDPALPKYGAIWLRKDIPLKAEQIGVPLYMYLGFKGVEFFQVYFNGKLVEQEDMDDYTRLSRLNSRIYLMPDNMREGVNKLALRLFSPSTQPRLAWAPGFNGDTKAGGWMAKAEFALPDFQKDKNTPRLPRGLPTLPGTIFNGMIHPLVPYAVRGFLWYQGESNAYDGIGYRKLMPLLIQDWRNRWGDDRLPFYYCQLANWEKKNNKLPGESDWAQVREAQLMTLSVPDTGMAVLIDTGESNDIHPMSKDVAGERLVRIALAKTYGKPIAYSGPIYDSMKVENGKIRISFKHVEGGLVAKAVPANYDVMRKTGKTEPLVRNSPESELEGFAICGPDPSTPEGSAVAGHKWVWADAKIQSDNTVLVWSDEIKEPVAVRYGWDRNPTCNLYNKADLPASPFRTDDFEVSGGRKVSRVEHPE